MADVPQFDAPALSDLAVTKLNEVRPRLSEWIARDPVLRARVFRFPDTGDIQGLALVTNAEDEAHIGDVLANELDGLPVLDTILNVVAADMVEGTEVHAWWGTLGQLRLDEEHRDRAVYVEWNIGAGIPWAVVFFGFPRPVKGELLHPALFEDLVRGQVE